MAALSLVCKNHYISIMYTMPRDGTNLVSFFTWTHRYGDGPALALRENAEPWKGSSAMKLVTATTNPFELVEGHDAPESSGAQWRRPPDWRAEIFRDAKFLSAVVPTAQTKVSQQSKPCKPLARAKRIGDGKVPSAGSDLERVPTSKTNPASLYAFISVA